MVIRSLNRIRRHLDVKSMRALYDDIAGVLDRIPTDFAGGCPLGKAFLMAELIRRYDLRVTVDIGVLRGRSLFPQSLAHRRFTGGVVYGIDPWLRSESMEYDTPALREKIFEWVRANDHQALYEGVASLVGEMHLERHCVLLRRTSAEAIAFFEGRGICFDLVHIDGNHDTAKVLADVRLYAPRLKKNGFIIFDDVSWASTQPAYEELRASMALLFHGNDPLTDYAVFWKGDSCLGAAVRRRLVRRLGRFCKG